MPPFHARTVASIDTALAAATARRRAARLAIARHQNEMRRSLAAIELYERQIDTTTGEIDRLFDERARAQIRAQADALAAG